jgi:hypothetical protein
MARKTILDTYYTFSPSTRTVVIPHAVPRERLVLITDITTNQVLYNFSDSSLKSTSYAIATDTNNNTTTTIVLNYNTTSLSATDKLSIVVDDYEETFKPTEILYDPVNKLRVSMPQSLIDTDFEYSTQPTKWENLALMNNRPFAYYNTYNTIAVSDFQVVNGSRTVTVSCSAPHGLSVGTPVYTQDTIWSGADGLFVIDSVPLSTTYTYTARTYYTGITGSIFNSGTTTAYVGYTFSGSNIPISSITYSGTAVTVTTTTNHGLVLGNEIAMIGLTATTNAPNGSWYVASVTSPTVFTYYPYSIGAPTGSIGFGSAFLYCRPQSSFNHRPFDGGVQFSANASSHNQIAFRQTRRYFRYQSGKGIMMSTGTILRPNVNLDQISSVGTTITVTTKIQHNINVGATITVAGCNESAYNGAFIVTSILNAYQFTYTAASTPSASPSSGLAVLSITSWYGGNTRVGLYDQQNGIFFEFDGQTLYAVRRSSTYQLFGWISVNAGASVVNGITVNGVTTTFSKQLIPGDYVVIRGMSYRVDTIISDTQMTIIPGYRGSSNIAQTVISKTVETKIPSSAWNIDRCDGTGPSGFNINLNRMQMFYLDYSWYGAGFIRWGFRGTTGDVVYCHKLANNNINYLAYMRSGNLPARYETNTYSFNTTLAASVATGDTTITCSSLTYYSTPWPTSGTVLLRNNTAYEYINYTGISGNILTGCTRGQAGGTVTATTITAGSPTILVSSTSGIQIGQEIIGTGIAPGTTVISYVANTSIFMSIGATASGTNVSVILAPMANTAQAFTYSSTAPISVELHSPQYSSEIDHWGTSVIMDGRFDDDKSYVFTKGMTGAVTIASGVNNAVMSFRISPSVSNGIQGTALGNRELVNRMQMVLRTMDVFTTGQYLIQLVLNGVVSSSTPSWSPVGGSSLAQYVFHNAGTTIIGGETVFGFFLQQSGGSSGSVTQQDLSLVRDLGTSVLSGGSAAPNLNIYPDGPDVITVMAQNIGGTSSTIFGRVSWTEAQA